MTPAQLNAILASQHPAAHRLLSPLGLRAALPLGIPQQAAQARDCVRKATIGEITDGAGVPMTPPSLGRYFDGLDPKAALRYAPQHGMPELRRLWRERAVGDAPTSLPVVTTGITHAISLCADLFTGPDRPVLVGAPYWDNYDNVFTLRTGAPIRTYRTHRAGDGRFDVDALREVLAALQGPATLLLNFPTNPSGYTLHPDEAAAVEEAICAHPGPLCVLLDDAYGGLYYEPDIVRHSLYDALARRADPERLLVCKADGSTKELVFFGGRIGFLTFSAVGAAGEALAEKAAALVRATISSACAVTQQAVLQALQSPTLPQEVEAVRRVLEGRYRRLRRSLDEANIAYTPFNSGCFAMIPVRQDAEEVRQRLIHEQSVGAIAVNGANALRLAFCSMEENDIPDLVSRLQKVIGDIG